MDIRRKHWFIEDTLSLTEKQRFAFICTAKAAGFVMQRDLNAKSLDGHLICYMYDFTDEMKKDKSTYRSGFHNIIYQTPRKNLKEFVSVSYEYIMRQMALLIEKEVENEPT